MAETGQLEVKNTVFDDLSFNVDKNKLHFGFLLCKRMTLTFYVYNLKTAPQKVQVSNPVSNCFKVDSHCRSIIFPGLPLAVSVTFCASEERKYTDEIFVDCCGEEKISIYLEAIPENPKTTIPLSVDLGILSQGISVEYKILVHPEPGDGITMFWVFPLWDATLINNDLMVHPLTGIINPGGPPTEIVLTCTPSEFANNKSYELQVDVRKEENGQIYKMDITFGCAPEIPGQGTMLKTIQQDMLQCASWDARVFYEGKKAKRLFTYLTYYDQMMNIRRAKNNTFRIAALITKRLDVEKKEYHIIGPVGKYFVEDKEMFLFKSRIFLEVVNKVIASPNAVKKLAKLISHPIKEETKYFTAFALTGTKPDEEFDFRNMVTPLNFGAVHWRVADVYTRQERARGSSSGPNMGQWPGFYAITGGWFCRYRTLHKFTRAAESIINAEWALPTLIGTVQKMLCGTLGYAPTTDEAGAIVEETRCKDEVQQEPEIEKDNDNSIPVDVVTNELTYDVSKTWNFVDAYKPHFQARTMPNDEIENLKDHKGEEGLPKNGFVQSSGEMKFAAFPSTARKSFAQVCAMPAIKKVPGKMMVTTKLAWGNWAYDKRGIFRETPARAKPTTKNSRGHNWNDGKTNQPVAPVHATPAVKKQKRRKKIVILEHDVAFELEENEAIAEACAMPVGEKGKSYLSVNTHSNNLPNEHENDATCSTRKKKKNRKRNRIRKTAPVTDSIEPVADTINMTAQYVESPQEPEDHVQPPRSRKARVQGFECIVH